MSESKYNTDTDLNEALAMAESLGEYVRSEELYGHTSGGSFSSQMPSLTVGALLLRLRRLNARWDDLSEKQQSMLESANNLHAAVQKEWTLHYEKKLTREAKSRLDAMWPYFEECRENPRLGASAYRPEALRRTIVQEIFLAMEELRLTHKDLQARARETDARLRGLVGKNEFLWDTVLQPVYDEKTYWWLYHRPLEPKRE